MNKQLQNYLLNECLYTGVDTIVYRARKKNDLSSVIIKTPKAEQPAPEQIARLYHEYHILQALIDVKGVVHADALEHDQNHIALILEDCGGISLKEILGSSQVPVLAFLPIAIQLVEILHLIHQQGVVHKNIRPRHILLVPETWTVQLIDFSSASQLHLEAVSIDQPDLPQNILADLSPEQIKKNRWLLDYYSDFYSLGVTFYELLMGQVPFTSDSASEFIHYHSHNGSALLDQVLPGIPKTVSAIVIKLIIKIAKERYHNALELKRDLEICLYQLQSYNQAIHC